MIQFDTVPVMDREYFELCLRTATDFAVWVQINPALQRLVYITKEQARDIGYDGLKFGYIWGNFEYGCLQISLNSQWLDTLAVPKE